MSAGHGARKQAENTLHLHGHEWDAKQLSVQMGFDALRLSLGGKPAVFTPKEIILWFTCLAKAAKP